MKKLAKKLCSVITVIAVILSAVSTLPVALAATAVTTLELDVPATATINEIGNYAEFAFTPQEDAVYSFYSTGDSNTCAEIWGPDGSRLSYDDDGGSEVNFNVFEYMNAGQTYTLRAQFLSGDAGSFSVVLTKTNIASVTFESASIIENSDGYTETTYNEETGEYDLEWFRYYVSSPRFTVNFTDGTSTSSNSNIEYNGEWYYPGISSNQSYENQWTVGNTYQVDVSLFGFDTTFDVTIIENPVESVVIEDISIVENSNGEIFTEYDYETGEEYEWFCYNTFFSNFTVNFKDGTSISNDEGIQSILYNGRWYRFEITSNQSYENQWTVGNTYEATGKILGVEGTFNVTIDESPVESVTIEDISIIENYDGWFNQEYNPNTDEYDIEWFCYGDYYPNFTVNFKDGTSISNDEDSSGIWYNDEWHSLEITNNQSYENQWTVGNTYEVTGNILGVESTFNVTVIPSPVKSISVEPMSIQEGTNGWWTWAYDNGGERVDYYSYNWYCDIELAVKFEDGTTETCNYWNNTISYGDYEFRFNYTDSQWWNNTWTVGNTYTEQVSFGGITTDVNITITEAPYESIEIISAEPLKETDYDYINENGDAIYSIPPFTYKITFKDGTTLTRDSYFYYEDHHISTSSSQYSNPWTIGGENLVTVSIGKASTTFSVVITEVSDWEYTVQDGKAYITNCGLIESEITVPEEIDGYTVVGVMSMGDCLNSASVINLPDSVVFLSGEAFDGGYNLDAINVGANISELDPDAFANCSVCNINVSENNPYFSTVDGIVYNKSGDTLVVYPLGQGYTYCVPDNVVDANVMLEKDYYSWVTLEFSENCKAFKEVDGITYSGDMTIVISCDPEKTGSYNMPDTVTDIKEFAFSGSKLSNVTVSDNVSELVYNVFSYCNNLETITLPDMLTSIGESAFFESNVKNLTRLPNSLTDIGANAFAGTNLTSMTIPSSVNEIGNSAFAYSTLETLNVGSGLSEIPRDAFTGTALTTVTLPDNIEYVGASAFRGSNVSKVTFKADEVYIDAYAFADCPLDKTTLSNNIIGFGAFAFSGNSMTSVKIPDSVTDITYYSFAYSEDLANIDIPDSLESVDGHAFEGTAWYKVQADGVVYLENVLYRYKGDIPENTEISVKPGTTVIADYAFEMGYDLDDNIIRDVSGLKSVTLPDGVKTIGVYAFYDCINLEKIVIPASVETIEEYAFYGCDNLAIYGYEGSYAETYAENYGIPFVTMVSKENEDVKVTAPPEVIDQNAELIVEPIESDDVVESLPEEIQHTNVVVFDIRFELDGETVQPNGTVTVEINVPQGLSGKHCKVYHIADDGTVTDMNAVFTGDKLVFGTTHFSVYTIVENKPAYTSGDVNEDGKINNRDYALLMQYINKWDVTIVEDSADVNRDGKINNRDYALLMQYINKWDVELQ